MSVDLADFSTDAANAVDSPGGDNFPNATSGDWTNSLINAFWDLRLDGFLTAYTENADGNSPGIITPVNAGTPDISRVMIQLIIFYSWKNALLNSLSSLATGSSLKAVAGPVSFETSSTQNAQLLRDILADIIARANRLFTELSSQGVIPIGYSDANFNRTFSIAAGLGIWER